MRGRLVFSAAALVLVAAGCGSSKPAAPRTFSVSGHLELDDLVAAGGDCVGSNSPGFEDIRPGAEVVVRNDAGRKVGLGQLGMGKRVGAACSFPYRVTGVPARGTIFSVEVTHRGQISFKRSDASAVDFTLGNQ